MTRLLLAVGVVMVVGCGGTDGLADVAASRDADTVADSIAASDSEADARVTTREDSAASTTSSTEDTAVLIEDTAVLIEDTAVVVEDTAVPTEDTTVLVEDTAVPSEDTTVLSDDTSVPIEDTSAPGEDTVPTADTVSCDPTVDCSALGYECGVALDGCGAPHACGVCDPDMACTDHRCVSACIPTAASSSAGGGRCADLSEAWTGRGINVGYFPFRVRAPIEMVSGDYDGAADAVFARGPSRAGVVLQIIPVGAYVGLSSEGPWYDPPSGDCFPTGETCGSPTRSACASSSPPRRPARGGYVWGYAYAGASHMQGWIPADFTRLVFAGFDPDHPCALGPAGLDFEAASACGQPTVCHGTNRTCGAANPCSEGADDCGRTACGAASGGPLTPRAWHRTVGAPASHVCTTRTPPHPSVRCFANGSDADFFFVYPFGAYLYWAQNSTTKAWLHDGDTAQVYFHTRDAQGVLWDFVEVLSSGAPVLTPASDGSGGDGACASDHPESCDPCQHGGTCGWVQDVFLD